MSETTVEVEVAASVEETPGRQPVLLLQDVERTYRQLALVWGVYPQLVSTAATYEEMFERGSRAVKEAGFAKAGDRILVTAGVPFDVPGTTNLLRVEHV